MCSRSNSSDTLSDSEVSECSQSEVIVPTRMTKSDSTRLHTLAAETSAYISVMSSTLTESDISSYFAIYGAIESVKICRDLDGQSLGCGYIYFKDKQARDAAIEKGRFQVEGQDVLIKEATIQDRNESNIYIRNLNENIDTQQLRQLFGTFGTVISCKVLYDNITGKHLGRAYVQFDVKTNAANAIKYTNGKLINGTVVQAELYLSKQDRQNLHSLYLKGIPSNSTSLDIYNLFSIYGSIKSLYLPINGKDGTKVGWGYVNYNEEDAADVAQHLLDGYMLGGVYLSVTKAGYDYRQNMNTKIDTNGKSIVTDCYKCTKVILSGIHPCLCYQQLEDTIETLVGVYPRNLTLFEDSHRKFVGQALFEARCPMDASQLVYNFHGKFLMGCQVVAEFLGKPIRGDLESIPPVKVKSTNISRRSLVSPVLYPPPIWLFQGLLQDQSKLLFNSILYHPAINGDSTRAYLALELLSRHYRLSEPLGALDFHDISRYLYSIKYVFQRGN